MDVASVAEDVGSVGGLTLPIGNVDLLSRPKIAFLASRNAPAEAIPLICDWVDSLDPASCCVMVGDMIGIERMVWQRLVQRGVPVVLVFSGELPKLWPSSLLNAAAENRLLVLTVVDFAVNPDRVVGRAELRNRYLLANADHVVVGYLNHQGRLANQLRGLENVSVLG